MHAYSVCSRCKKYVSALGGKWSEIGRKVVGVGLIHLFPSQEMPVVV